METVGALEYAFFVSLGWLIGAFTFNRIVGRSEVSPSRQFLTVFIALSVAAFSGHLK